MNRLQLFSMLLILIFLLSCTPPTTLEEKAVSSINNNKDFQVLTKQKNNKIVETPDYTITLEIKKDFDYCKTTHIKLNWCSDYDKKFSVLSCSFYLKPKTKFDGGPSGMTSYVFNEKGDSLRLVSTGYGGGYFNWWDGWRNYFSYPIDKMFTDLPKTDKLILIYDEIPKIVGESLENLKNNQNRFMIDYSEIQSIAEGKTS